VQDRLLKCDQFRIPLVVGVSGHRDIDPSAIDRLEMEVFTFFTILQDQVPETPILLLTALAEGADRLVARVFKSMGGNIAVPLPFDIETYKADFTSLESKDEFDRMLEDALEHLILPPVDCIGCISAEEWRNHQYANSGAYIALHSHVLLALWDGEDNEMVGGTAHVVRFQKEGVPQPYSAKKSSLDPLETGPVYQIVTQRSDGPRVCEPFRVLPLYHAGFKSDHEAEKFYSNTFSSLNAFNKDVLTLDNHKGRASIYASVRELWPQRFEDTFPKALGNLRFTYAVADVLAMSYRRRSLSCLKSIYWIVFLAVWSFICYAHLITWGLVAAMYVLILLVAALVHQLARDQRLYAKHLDYRALAEGLRVQLFWYLCGIETAVPEVYLRKQRTQLEWIRTAIRSAASLASAYKCEPPEQLNMWMRVRRLWILRQAAFYRFGTRKDERIHKMLDICGRCLVGVAMCIAMKLFTMDWYGSVREFHDLQRLDFHAWFAAHGEHSSAGLLHGVLIMAAATSTAAAGFLFGYSKSRAFSEQSKQYSRMGALFRTALKRLSFRSSSSLLQIEEDVLTILRDLGEEALNENADWVSLHRARPLELPLG